MRYGVPEYDSLEERTEAERRMIERNPNKAEETLLLSIIGLVLVVLCGGSIWWAYAHSRILVKEPTGTLSSPNPR